MFNQNIPARQWAAITLLAATLFMISLWRLSQRNAPLAPPSPASVIVSVRGDVVHPGVYALPFEEATVEKAIRAAGGTRGEGGTHAVGHLGQQRLQSGGQLRIVLNAHGGVQVILESMDAASRLALSQKLDVNAATEEELAFVPSMRKEIAAAIVSRRREAPWKSLKELEKIPGVGARTVEKWKEYLEVTGED